MIRVNHKCVRGSFIKDHWVVYKDIKDGLSPRMHSKEDVEKVWDLVNNKKIIDVKNDDLYDSSNAVYALSYKHNRREDKEGIANISKKTFVSAVTNAMNAIIAAKKITTDNASFIDSISIWWDAIYSCRKKSATQSSKLEWVDIGLKPYRILPIILLPIKHADDGYHTYNKITSIQETIYDLASEKGIHETIKNNDTLKMDEKYSMLNVEQSSFFEGAWSIWMHMELACNTTLGGMIVCISALQIAAIKMFASSNNYRSFQSTEDMVFDYLQITTAKLMGTHVFENGEIDKICVSDANNEDIYNTLKEGSFFELAINIALNKYPDARIRYQEDLDSIKDLWKRDTAKLTELVRKKNLYSLERVVRAIAISTSSAHTSKLVILAQRNINERTQGKKSWIGVGSMPQMQLLKDINEGNSLFTECKQFDPFIEYDNRAVRLSIYTQKCIDRQWYIEVVPIGNIVEEQGVLAIRIVSVLTEYLWSNHEGDIIAHVHAAALARLSQREHAVYKDFELAVVNTKCIKGKANCSIDCFWKKIDDNSKHNYVMGSAMMFAITLGDSFTLSELINDLYEDNPGVPSTSNKIVKDTYGLYNKTTHMMGNITQITLCNNNNLYDCVW